MKLFTPPPLFPNKLSVSKNTRVNCRQAHARIHSLHSHRRGEGIMNYQGWKEQQYLKQAAPERRERVVVPYDDVMQTSCVMCAVTSVTDALRTRRAFWISACLLRNYNRTRQKALRRSPVPGGCLLFVDSCLMFGWTALRSIKLWPCGQTFL